MILTIGFACFGGLLAGYSVARLCPAWMLRALWAIGLAAGSVAAVVSANQSDSGDLTGAIVLFGVLVPFTGCAIVAGLIGLVARRVAEPAS